MAIKAVHTFPLRQGMVFQPLTEFVHGMVALRHEALKIRCILCVLTRFASAEMCANPCADFRDMNQPSVAHSVSVILA